MEITRHILGRQRLSRALSALVILALAMPLSASARSSYALQESLSLPGSVHWDYLTFDAARQLLFITRGDSVDVLDVTSKKIIASISDVTGVHGVALATDINKGFISEGKANRVAIFDLNNFKSITTVSTGIKPDAIVYDQSTGMVFSVNGGSSDLTVIDAKTNQVRATIKLDGVPEFAVDDDKGHLYINLEEKSQINIVDTHNLKITGHYDLAPACIGPTGLAIDKSRNRLFSTCSNKTMVIVSADTGEIIDRLPIGEHSDAAAFDENTGLAFSSNGDGTLTVVGSNNDDHYQVVQTVQTKPTARTMALDPISHTLYLAAAETDGFDPPSAQQAKPRPHLKPDTFSMLIVK